MCELYSSALIHDVPSDKKFEFFGCLEHLGCLAVTLDI